MSIWIRWRQFISLIGGAAAAFPLAARAQQPALPVIGFVNGAATDAYPARAAAFRKGLEESGYVEGQNVTVEYHWLDGRYDLLPALMADFVRRRHRVQIVTLAARYSIPAIYANRESVEAGGLMAYSHNVASGFHQVGVYAGKILKGTKPADLPVVQLDTKFEFTVNLQTAKMLGITVPNTLLVFADELLE